MSYFCVCTVVYRDDVDILRAYVEKRPRYFQRCRSVATDGGGPSDSCGMNHVAVHVDVYIF